MTTETPDSPLFLDTHHLLVAVIATIAAEHGVEATRRVVDELVRNDELWTGLGEKLGLHAADIDTEPPPAFDDEATAAAALGADDQGGTVPSDFQDISEVPPPPRLPTGSEPPAGAEPEPEHVPIDDPMPPVLLAGDAIDQTEAAELAGGALPPNGTTRRRGKKSAHP